MPRRRKGKVPPPPPVQEASDHTDPPLEQNGDTITADTKITMEERKAKMNELRQKRVTYHYYLTIEPLFLIYPPAHIFSRQSLISCRRRRKGKTNSS